MGIVLRTILIVLVSCFANLAMAQERPLVHKINGKKYYLHVVEPGNTLYGISRTYEVSITDIQASNDEALVEDRAPTASSTASSHYPSAMVCEKQGKVAFYNDSKGYGFINDLNSQEKYFFHVNGLIDEVTENDKVTFEVERGLKGMNAVRVKKV